jgi:hypothetical protein
MLRGNAPDISHLRSIGAKAYLYKFPPTRDNNMARKTNHDGVLIGYAIHTKGYRILTNLTNGTIVETMN